MCGIAGLITSSPAGSAAVAAMLAVQAHRGPDGSGQWSSSDGRVHLGHRRLAILDRSARGVGCERRLKRPKDRPQRREALLCS